MAAETTLADSSTRTASTCADSAGFALWRRLRVQLRQRRLALRRRPDVAARLVRGDRASTHRWPGPVWRCPAILDSAAGSPWCTGGRARRGLPSRNPQTVAIVTGQQAGAFGGPLFTLLKAITAIQLAQKTSREHQVRRGPGLLGRRRGSRLGRDRPSVRCSIRRSSRRPSRFPRLKAQVTSRSRRSMLDTGVEQSLDALASALGETEFTPALMAGLRAAYRPGAGVVDAFARWFETLLGPHGLVVFDSSDPAAKPLVAELFTRELRYAGPHRVSRRVGGRSARRAGPRAAGGAAKRQRLALLHRRRPPPDPQARRRVRCRRQQLYDGIARRSSHNDS